MSDVNHQFLMQRNVGFAIALLVVVALMSLRGAHAEQPVIAASAVANGNPVRSVAVTNPNPARQAFSATFSQSSTTALNVSFGEVPSGKRLVIENESVACYASGEASILYAYMITNLGRTYLLLQKVGHNYALALDYYAGTYTSTMYADPNGLGTGDITFVLQAAAGATVHCDGAIVGHNVASPIR